MDESSILRRRGLQVGKQTQPCLCVALCLWGFELQGDFVLYVWEACAAPVLLFWRTTVRTLRPFFCVNTWQYRLCCWWVPASCMWENLFAELCRCFSVDALQRIFGITVDWEQAANVLICTTLFLCADLVMIVCSGFVDCVQTVLLFKQLQIICHISFVLAAGNTTEMRDVCSWSWIDYVVWRAFFCFIDILW